MGDIALLTVIGRLTRDAVFEPLQNSPGRGSVKFTVASSYYVRGQQDRPTAFYECRMFMGQERFNSASQFLKKGRLICAHGELRPRLAPDQQGGQKMWLNLEEVGFEPVGPKPEGQTSAPPQTGGYQQGGYQQGGYTPPPAQAAPPGAEAGLPNGWTQQTDPSSGRPYYVGPQGQTQWEPPAAPPAQAAPPAAPPPATPPPNTPPGAQGGPPGYGGSPI